MEFEVVKDQKNHVEFLLKGERHTFSNLLVSRLQQDSEVTFASYLLDHPLEDQSRFVVKTKAKPAKKVIEHALDKIEDELKNFESEIKKAMK